MADQPPPAIALTKPFVPSPKQLAFLHAICEAITEGSALSNRALCAVADVSLQALWKWKHKTPAFNDWLAEQVRKHAAAPVEWEMVQAIVYARAKEGNEKAINQAIEIHRGASFMVGNGMPGASGTTLIFNLPRPPKELEGQTIVVDAVSTEKRE